MKHTVWRFILSIWVTIWNYIGNRPIEFYVIRVGFMWVKNLKFGNEIIITPNQSFAYMFKDKSIAMEICKIVNGEIISIRIGEKTKPAIFNYYEEIKKYIPTEVPAEKSGFHCSSTNDEMFISSSIMKTPIGRVNSDGVENI